MEVNWGQDKNGQEKIVLTLTKQEADEILNNLGSFNPHSSHNIEDVIDYIKIGWYALS